MTIHEFLIDRLARPALLTETREHGAALCLACAHRCLVRPGRRGICKVRYNNAGALLAPWGYVAGLAADPVEKKPFNHFLPGSRALTFGMLGCNYHCAFCQNWFTSQALRDPVAQASLTRIEEITPEQIAEIATRRDCASVVSSYNEPFITAEWARDIFMAAKARGLRTAMVSNGYGTAEALDLLAPHLDALKVDLKSMRDATYRQLGGVLANVLETISAAAARGIWVEVVTLVIPGMNDSPAELWDAARFLAGISRDLPWHVTAFHPDYKMDDTPPTSAEKLREALEIGEEAGLRHVYSGNLPGRVRGSEDTRCPSCHSLLVRRRGFMTVENHLAGDGGCTHCGARIPGIWA